MASYPTQILDAPPQYGFIPGLASGMSSAGQTFGNAYGEAAVKDIFDRQKKKKTQEEMNEYMKAMQEGGYEIDSSTINDEGDIKYTWKKKATPESTFTDAYSKDPQKIIKQAMGGMLPDGQMEQLGQAQGIQPQQRMPMDRESLINRAILSPNLSRMQNIPKLNIPSMPFSLTPMNVQGGQFTEYPDLVQQENLKKFGSGFTPEQVKRDAMGLPTETPAEKLAVEQAKEQAKQPVYNPATTSTVKQNIKTKEDIEELLKQRKAYEDAGVDVISILKEYLMTNPDPGILDKIKRFLAD